jgi:RNA polymerase sigma-70 factor (ECF subfamily)
VSLARKTALRIVGGVRSRAKALVESVVAAGERSEADPFQDAASGLLFGLLLLILNDTTSAEEVLLEVHVEVRKHAARFEKSQDDLLTWLITVTHRHALERLCSSSGDQQFVVSVGLARAPGAGEPRRFGINKSAHRRLVAASLDSLSPIERKMIELAYFSRMSPLAIALNLRESPDAVKAGLQHGISQLYNLFKSQGVFAGAPDGAEGRRKRAGETITAECLVLAQP